MMVVAYHKECSRWCAGNRRRIHLYTYRDGHTTHTHAHTHTCHR